jgi:antitoxin HicB
MRFDYPITIEPMTPEDGGGFLVTFPDWWNGVVTDGDTATEALANAKDCLEELIAYCILKREDIPSPSPPRGRRLVSPEIRLALKAGVWLAMYEREVGFSELARRLALPSAAEAEKLLDPRRRTRPELLEAAAAALGKRVALELQDAA